MNSSHWAPATFQTSFFSEVLWATSFGNPPRVSSSVAFVKMSSNGTPSGKSAIREASNKPRHVALGECLLRQNRTLLPYSWTKGEDEHYFAAFELPPNNRWNNSSLR